MKHQPFEKACHRLIDSVWTVTFRRVSDFSVEVLAYNREDDDGYKYESVMPHGRLIEDDSRTVTGIKINGDEYTVENPKHIFKYSR
jgi:hypothetical protein